MKIKDEYILRQVADSYVVVCVGKNASGFNKGITLNESGAFIFEKFKKETTIEKVVEDVCAEYGIINEQAKPGVEKMVAKITEAGLLD